MATGSLQVNRDIILANKRQVLAERARKIPMEAVLALAQMQQRPRYFLNTVQDAGEVALVGQVTRTAIYDPVAASLRLLRAGMDAVAFFTDHTIYAHDMDDLLMVARGLQQAPVVMQNYVLDEYSVITARASNASALVLYASLLEPSVLRRVVSMTQRWHMTAMVQANTPEEVEQALSLSPHVLCLGDNLVYNLDYALDLLAHVRAQIPFHVKTMLMPSLETLDDVRQARDAGVDALFIHDYLLSNDKRLKQLLALTGR